MRRQASRSEGSAGGTLRGQGGLPPRWCLAVPPGDVTPSWRTQAVNTPPQVHGRSTRPNEKQGSLILYPSEDYSCSWEHLSRKVVQYIHICMPAKELGFAKNKVSC